MDVGGSRDFLDDTDVHRTHGGAIVGKYSDNTSSSGDSSSKAAEAEHDARDHATKDGVFERGNDVKNSTPFENTPGGWASGFADALSGFFKK